MYLPKPNETNFELPPPGTHLAVCYRVIDLGTQSGTYMGKPKVARKVLISWELPDEKMTDGRPFTISQRYTWSMSEKATLRKHLESWRGKAFSDADFGPQGFNIKNILGVGCVLTITHETKQEKTYANISAVGKLMKGMVAPELTNPTAYLWIAQDHWDSETFTKLGDGLRNAIMGSPEYRELVNGRDNEPPPIDAPDTHSDPIPDFHSDPIPF